MFKTFKKTISLAISLILSAASISLYGCSTQDIRNITEKNDSSITQEYSYSQTGNTAFNEYTDNLFCEIVTDDTLSLHTLLEHPENYGINDYNITLGRIDTESLYDTSDITQYITELKAFDKNSLSQTQAVTYDYLLSYLESRLCYSDLDLYGSQLTPTIGMQIELPLVFSEYSFLEQKDVEEYLELLCDVDGYFENMLEYERLRADKGFTLKDSLLEDVISSCQSVIDSIKQENSTNRLFIDDFNSRIDALDFISDSDRQDYKKRNIEAVQKHVIPGYEALRDGLTLLKGTCRYQDGISSYPDGQRYFEGLLEQTLGWSKSIDEYSSLLESYMRNYLIVMRKLIQKNPSLTDAFSSYSFGTSNPQDIIEELKQKMSDDYPALDDIDYSIKYVSEALCDYASPAMYFMPQLDNPDINSI